MVLAPEHPLVDRLTTPSQRAAVAEYRARAASKSDLDRTDLARTKTGVADRFDWRSTRSTARRSRSGSPTTS